MTTDEADFLRYLKQQFGESLDYVAFN